MNVVGTDLVQKEVQQTGYFFKAILNDSGAVFFPGTSEHRTVKRAGLSYEHDYKGNAMAVVVTRGRIEIRNHRDFSVARVATIVNDLLKHPELQCLRGFPVEYGSNKLR